MTSAAAHGNDTRTALITGGTSGLGRAMVRALTGAGWEVAFTSRSAGRSATTQQQLPGSRGYVVDARGDSAVDGLLKIDDDLGGVDLLVLNAGVGMATIRADFLRSPASFWEVDPARFRTVMDTNVTGYFSAAAALVPRMLQRGHGRIVGISSTPETMARRGFIPYGPSKAAADALLHGMAEDLADSPVSVSVLIPGGPVATNIMPPDGLPPGMTLLDPDVVAAPIVWLASVPRSSVHGRTIVATEFRDDPPSA